MARARTTIAHHYDLGNDFYRALLGPTMAYSCGYWRDDGPGTTLDSAQLAKLDLVCRKLALRQGDTLLDVGCGWGSLLLYAAEHYGVRATGVTLSAQQYEYVRSQVVDRRLEHLVEVRLEHYRDIKGSFAAVASIEMGEHVGNDNYASYCEAMRSVLRPGGRLLLQQMSRSRSAPGGGPFIESYIARDMVMRPLHRTLEYLEAAGFEVRTVDCLREDYIRTIDAWAGRLETDRDEIHYRFGSRRARIWRLYLAGASLAFEANRMSVHQVVAKVGDRHAEGPSG
ncbi:cyclopropane-fatty-acyl-phospholipid synthase family protein [Actinosynnema sp. NPDC050801]|uniref:cyclopropane-fatty-acyl-phospholipid synthase family protein n=1 Tax=unclassified Actinosynnema TaxID=2637065 RepID=UPI00340B730E